MFVFLQADTPEALDEPLGALGGVKHSHSLRSHQLFEEEIFVLNETIS